jgi:hypothetical protein
VVAADGRFLQLVGVAKGKLEARPRELRSQELANMLNGEGVGGKKKVDTAPSHVDFHNTCTDW